MSQKEINTLHADFFQGPPFPGSLGLRLGALYSNHNANHNPNPNLTPKIILNPNPESGKPLEWRTL